MMIFGFAMMCAKIMANPIIIINQRFIFLKIQILKIKTKIRQWRDRFHFNAVCFTITVNAEQTINR
jgi:hypothetical protein